MSRSSTVMRPMPLRTSVGAIWEIRPPAPTQTTLAFENASWSNPGIFFWRSSAPGIGLPTSLIEVCETVNACCTFFHSTTVNFDFQIVIQPDEPDKAVTAKDGHHGD